MTTPFPFHQVIEEVLNEVFEDQIRKSIGELPLSFEKCQENGYTPYIIKNTNENLFALLYFSYYKPGFEVHLKRFLRVVKKLRQDDAIHIAACTIGTALCQFDTVKELVRTGIDFQMVSDQYFIDSFQKYGIILNKDLTMNNDGYTRYQNLSTEAKRELAEVLLDDTQFGIERLIKRITSPQFTLCTNASKIEFL